MILRGLRRCPVELWVALGLAAVMLGPLLIGRGTWLVGDMVFVPHQPWKQAWLGLDGSLPRAVPMDALVSLATQIVPGEMVQRILLVSGLVVGGLGAGRLVRDLPWFARVAAATLFCWNPWVLERLLIGQWAILLGYLLLPWVALAARRLRARPRDVGPAAVVLVLSAVCSPSSGVMAAAVLLVLVAGRSARTWWRPVLLGIVANLTWAVPALTAPAAGVSTEGVFEGFAARAESAAGVVASVVSLGGIWKTSVVPPERTSAVLVLLSCLLSAVALAGLRRAGEEAVRWWVLGTAAVALALLPVAPGGSEVLETLGRHVPGVALLRDSHRFAAPGGLVLAVGAAHAAAALAQRARPGRRAWWSAAALVVVAPVLLLPSLAWGSLGELQRSTYPRAWDEVAALVGPDEATVVLPWEGLYRGYPWNGYRAVLDPAPRYLPGVVLIDDEVRLEDRKVPAEDPRVVAVGEALTAEDVAAALRGLGVRWVLVEEGMGDPVLPAGATRYDAGGLRLIDLSSGGPVAPSPSVVQPEITEWRQFFVGAGHAASILLLFSGFAWILRSRE